MAYFMIWTTKNLTVADSQKYKERQYASCKVSSFWGNPCMMKDFYDLSMIYDIIKDIICLPEK